MEWSIVISLLALGLFLLVIEIFFVPGTTVVGLAGFAMMIAGIVFAFRYFGSSVGWITLGSTGVASGVLLYFAFRPGMWDKLALKSSSDGKVNAGEMNNFTTGQEGIAISALRPVGKADLGDRVAEVRTNGDYVESGTRVRIVKLLSNQIIVEPIK
jgi:membrane-bound ClpP family serine protease